MAEANAIARQSISKVSDVADHDHTGNLQENVSRLAELAEENHKQIVLLDGNAGFINELLSTDRKPVTIELTPFVGRHAELDDGYGKLQVTIFRGHGNTVIGVDDTTDRMNRVLFNFFVELGILRVENSGHGGVYRNYYVNQRGIQELLCESSVCRDAMDDAEKSSRVLQGG